MIPHESLRHLQRLSLSATISLREAGGEAVRLRFNDNPPSLITKTMFLIS